MGWLYVDLFLMASWCFQFLVLLSLNTEAGLSVNSFTCRLLVLVYFFKANPLTLYSPPYFSLNFFFLVLKAESWKKHVSSPYTCNFVTRLLIMPYNNFASAVYPFRSRVSVCRWICYCEIWKLKKFLQEIFKQGHNNTHYILSNDVSFAGSDRVQWQSHLLTLPVKSPKVRHSFWNYLLLSAYTYQAEVLHTA